MPAISQLLAFLPLGGWELAVIILVAAVLLFGKRLPEIGRSMGQSITEFKRGLSSGTEQKKLSSDQPDSAADKREQGQ